MTAIRPVRALDGWIVCAAVTSPQIAATFDALGHPEWTDDVLAHPNQHTLATAMYDAIERATQDLTVDAGARVLPRRRRAGRRVHLDGRPL